ncbi:MAG: DsbC family protein [Pseudomonadota bacterium]
MPISLTTRLFVAAVAVFATAGTALADAKLESVREKISGMFDQIEPGDVADSGIEGWYKVQRGGIVAYVSDDGRYLMQGDIIDLDRQVNLTELSRNTARRDLLSELDDRDVIAFSPADVKHTVTIFTDIECGYCRRLHAQIDEYLAEGIEVRYLLYPRNGPASRAWNTSEEVWCSADRPEALTAAKLDRDFESQSCDASTISSHYILGQEIGLSGTPSIVLEDGTLIGGYLPADALAARLQSSSAE